MPRAIAMVIVALALPASAQAATVSVYVPPCAPEQSKYGACYPDEARFAAGEGEQNDVHVTRAPSAPPSFQPKVTIADAGATLTAGAGCSQVDEHTATCTGYNVIAVLSLGDRDDAAEGAIANVDGGQGADTIGGSQTTYGGPGDDRLEGGDTGAYLNGGPGRDTISGGSGNDRIEDPEDIGEQDVVDGGDGVDVMSYAGRKRGMTVSLQQPLAGEDRLSAIESLRGGDGNDMLTGDAGPNVLDGGPGNDMVQGGEGADTVAGDVGTDALLGGAGADLLDPGEDKARNLVGCGGGEDHADPARNTLIGPDCELIGFDDFDLSGVVRLRLPLRSLRAPLLTMEPLGCVDLPCSVRLSVTAQHRVIGRAGAIQRKRSPKLPGRLALRLSAVGAAMVKRASPLQARIRILTRDGGERSGATFLVPLARR